MQSFTTSRTFSPWLYRIAHNTFINALKKNKSEKISFFDLDTLFPHPFAPETADSDAQRSEIRALLDQGLGRLDAKYREPLVLYYSEELEYAEIADVLHIPISTVGVRLQRGKKILKTILEHETPSTL